MIRGGVHIIYSADEKIERDNSRRAFHSRLGYAHSKNLTKIDKRNPLPIAFVDPRQYPNGIQDPRITKINKTYYIITSANNRKEVDWKKFDLGLEIIRGAYIYLIITRNFKSFVHKGDIGPVIYDKNCALHPEKIYLGNRSYFMMYHRVFPNIQAVLFETFQELKSNHYWRKQLKRDNLSRNTIMKPLFEWERCISLGPPTIKTTKGWLLIYNAANNNKIYSIGAALSELDNPFCVIHRSPIPILEPTIEEGNMYSTGATLINGTLYIYYGVGTKLNRNKEIRHAQVKIDRLTEYLTHFDSGGKIMKVEQNRKQDQKPFRNY